MFFDLTWEPLLGEHGYPVKPGMTLGLSPGLCLLLGLLLVTPDSIGGPWLWLPWISAFAGMTIKSVTPDLIGGL